MRYHSDSVGHNTNDCWALKHKIQDLIEAKEVEFDAPDKPNVISAPMPKHGRNVNAIEEDLYVVDVNDLITPLLTIKLNLLKAGIFPGCKEDCYCCYSLPFDCPLLKKGIQGLMDSRQILFEKVSAIPTHTEDVSIITIHANLSKAVKKPVKITPATKSVPLKITI